MRLSLHPLLRYTLLALIGILPALALAEDTPAPQAADTQPKLPFTPPWLREDVVKASLEIKMNDEQQGKFRTLVEDFMTKRTAGINKEMRRNAPELEHRIKRLTKNLAGDMDEQMKTMLTEAQWPAYEHYRETLLEALEKPR